MNSYISTTASIIASTEGSTTASTNPAGYVSTGRPAGTPTGYISPATRRGTGSYVTSEWVIAA
ncbi:hypothetical protein [Cryobacterium sp. W22_MBD10_FK3]|uniref:hypothetical protein n=1 Tax=Cryobacterium sp. W22_MBD10_FK3 TaxID=3240273 RepID=UPI003F92F6D6